jgi:hypothetical protein
MMTWCSHWITAWPSPRIAFIRGGMTARENGALFAEHPPSNETGNLNPPSPRRRPGSSAAADARAELNCCHPTNARNWIPAFAGMTARSLT